MLSQNRVLAKQHFSKMFSDKKYSQALTVIKTFNTCSQQSLPCELWQGPKKQGLMSWTPRWTPCKTCSLLQNMEQHPWIRENTVGEGCWSADWVPSLCLRQAAMCTAARPASSSISL